MIPKAGFPSRRGDGSGRQGTQVSSGNGSSTWNNRTYTYNGSQTGPTYTSFVPVVAACVPGGERQRELAMRFGVNLVMYVLTGNYKSDQVHVPAILERLGQ